MPLLFYMQACYPERHRGDDFKAPLQKTYGRNANKQAMGKKTGNANNRI